MNIAQDKQNNPNTPGLELEYQTLRDEILKRIDLRQQVVSIALTATAVFLGFGIENKNASLLFVYPPLAFFLAMAWAQNDISIKKLSGYIRDRIEESVLGLGWEKFIQENRTVVISKHLRFTMLSHGGVFLGSQILSVLVGVIVLDYRMYTNNWILIVIDIIAIVGVTWVLFRVRR
jgi:hypothetical protein